MRSTVGVLMLAACGRIGFPEGDGTPVDELGISGLVAYYPLDDDPATGVIACSDPLADGTCTQPDCPTATAGHINGAALFAVDRVLIEATDLLGTTPYTVSLWARFDNLDGWPTLLAKPSAPTDESDIFALGIISPTTIAFETTPDGASFGYVLGPVPTVGSWYHLAASWDGSDKRLYVDGALVGAETTAVVTSDEPIYLGVDVDNGIPVYSHEGAIDEIRIYNRALTDDQIALLAAQ